MRNVEIYLHLNYLGIFTVEEKIQYNVVTVGFFSLDESFYRGRKVHIEI